MIPIGDTTNVKLQEYVHGLGKTYFAPHDSEHGAVVAAQAVIAAHGGRLLYLSHGGTRNISFKLKGVVYQFDPNRMFSPAGAAASMKAQSRGRFSQDALSAVNAFAKHVLALIETTQIVVGVHTNVNGYSILDYLPGGTYASAAVPGSVLLRDAANPGNFFYTTTQQLYQAIASKTKYNVMLQAAGAPDDGSLSVWCANRGVPYVNCEVRAGHVGAQEAMLNFLATL